MSPKVNIVPMNSYVKEKTMLHVARRMNEVFDVNLLYDLIGVALEDRKQNEAPIDSIKRIDLTRIMKQCTGLNERFQCSFFMNRTAWIHQKDNGHFRYYSRRNKSVFSYDILDLLEVIRNEDRKTVLSFIQKTWDLPGLTGWYSHQTEKHELNQLILQQLQSEPTNYPNLDKLLGKNWTFLEIINEYSSQNLVGESCAVDQEAVFFVSNKYLNETYFPKASPSKTNSLMNLVCVLGFLRKVPADRLSDRMAKEAEVQRKLSKQKKGASLYHDKNHTSFYSVMGFQSILEEAEKRAEILVKENIYFHSLTRKVVQELFGEDFCNQIYVQRTFGNKPKAEPIYFKGQNQTYTETERLEKIFLNNIETTGKCEKTLLHEASLLPYRRFSTAWKTLIEKYHCEEKYPTQEEMKQFDMEKRYLIAVPVNSAFAC